MKRRLRSIKARYPGLGFWWPAFVFIFLLCLMIILKHPYIEEWGTVGLVVVTLMYVIFTKRILDEMRRQRLNASQAVIWPVVWWKEYYLEVTLNNIGNAPALKVKVFLQDELIITSRSHIPQGDKVVFRCLEPGGGAPRLEPLTPMGIDVGEEFLKRIAGLVGQYLLVVTWDDLLEQHFEAKLLFSLQVDSEGRMSSKILEEPKLREVKGQP